ncbi:hypothetical protein ACRN9A_19040 [Shewanella frigidimarina]|uniref:hypothetical protein n=1 Tax=Shewanella frigidimarina TaxID=56812 RepID=UPI003D7A2B3C|tara:strand:+ start:214 stop:705 length:492 start_codon:yes stop_codon:yes gene_type:complete
MNNELILQTIFLGVVSGLVATGFAVMLSKIFNQVLIPWYQAKIYKGVDISGVWEGSIESNNDKSWGCTLELEQNAHNIVGTYTTVSYYKGEQQRISVMDVNGEVWEGYISLKCRTKSNRNLSFGSMLFQINNQEIVGHQVFRNNSKYKVKDIFHTELTLSRET